MDDGLNVAFVDTHTEGNGAAQDLGPVLNEFLLDIGSLLIRLSCVVRSCFHTVLRQKLGELVCCASLSGKDQDRGKISEAWRA